jgi:SAM-dependent methyltransferase
MNLQDPTQSDPGIPVTRQNRKAWNEIAEVRSRVFPPAEFFAGGGSMLEAPAVQAVQDAFGPIQNLKVIHLQCATGEDTLSWAVLGANAYGVDIAERQIELAREKAAKAGLSAAFAAADVYDLPAALPADWPAGQFDLVFTGGGAIVWLPDLPRWARVVAALLRAGGRLVLMDEHPLAACISMEDNQLVVMDDYFRRERAWEGAGWSHFAGGEFARENKYEFTWPLGDIVTALAAAGLLLERLEEFRAGPGWRFQGDDSGLEKLAHLPGSYLAIARKL